MGPRYRGLIQDIFQHAPLPNDFSMYLHAPTRTDPSMAPQGCESLYVLVPTSNLKNGMVWDTHDSHRFQDRILAHLEEWGLTGLRDHIEVLEVRTPQDFVHHFQAADGQAFGLEPRITQIANLRPHNRSEDVRGLYIVGASTHPGAGIPGVLLSARATEQCIRADFPS